MYSYKSKLKSEETVEFPFLDKPVEVFKFNNGHTVILAQKEGELVNVSTWVKTGSINENDEITGISHFLEHLMFKGTPKYPAGHFDRVLEAKGAIVNAATWKDYTFYYVTLPKGQNEEQMLEAIELHSDMMLNPTLPEDEIGPVFDVKNPEVKEKRERYVVIEEIRMRADQPWTKTYNELNHNMYEKHPYKRDVIGTAEVVATVPRDTIMDYYKNWYTPENMTTIIVGEFDSEKIIELISSKFDFKEERVCKRHEYEQESEQTEQKYFEQKSNINTGFVMFGFHGANAKELKETIALDVLGIILGEGKSSRLNQNLIEKPEHPVFNLVGSDQYHFRDGNAFFVQGNFDPSKKDEALELIKNELKSIIEAPVLDSEFSKAKKKLKARFAEGAETVSEIGETIGYYMTVCDDLAICSDYLKILDGLGTDDLQAIANKYLALNKATISVLLPE